MSVWIVEVLAIYEQPGVNVTQQRRNQRDQDLAQAAAQSDKYAPGGVAPADEYLEAFEAPSRYGFGWRCRQFVTVQQTASDLGTLVFNRLVTRNLQAGSKVLVFADHRDEGSGGVTDEPVYARWWPRATPPEPDIG